MRQDDIRKELEEIAPELSKLAVHEGKSIPDGYFETLPDATWKKISRNNATKIISQPKYSFRLISGIAASLLIMIGCFYLINQQPVQNDEILVEDMVDYMLDEVDYVDAEQLFEVYSIEEDLVENDIEEFEFLEEEGFHDLDEQFLETLY